MEGYLGTELVTDLTNTPYAGYTSIQWALVFIESYGQIDGAHHKTWVIDQVTRILKGTPVVVNIARWENGQVEYRFHTGDVSPMYERWVIDMKGDYDEVNEEYEYSYDDGCAP